MTLKSWYKNRGLQQRRDVENQRRDVAESARTEQPDITTIMGGEGGGGTGTFWGVLEGGKHPRTWFFLGKKMD